MLIEVNWKSTLPSQHSHIAPNLTDCKNSTDSKWHQIEGQKFRLVVKTFWKVDMPVLGLAGCHRWEMKNGRSRYADWRPNLYHQIKWVSPLVAVPNDLPLPPAKIGKILEVLHFFRWYTHTHTCSETSYRITDVECIARAKTLQLNLTGMVWWLEVRNCARKSFYVLARRIYWFWCSSVRLRKPYSSLKTVGKTTCRFLA